MFQDEDGNIWASYEDYQDYLNTIENSDESDLMTNFIKEMFSEVYIDEKNNIWESKEKYLENGEYYE